MTRYFLTIFASLLLLSGCSSSNSNATPNGEFSQNIQLQLFVDDENGLYKLTSTDNFETAKLVDTFGNEYYLKRAPAGSGIYLENGDTSVHFSSRYAAIVIEGKEISVEPKN
ncbi:MAG: hypothetical protein MR902_01435 [Campylobacter sp.]|nr:hypothetical protein [Campylobacter sp.]